MNVDEDKRAINAAVIRNNVKHQMYNSLAAASADLVYLLDDRLELLKELEVVKAGRAKDNQESLGVTMSLSRACHAAAERVHELQTELEEKNARMAELEKNHVDVQLMQSHAHLGNMAVLAGDYKKACEHYMQVVNYHTPIADKESE